MCCWAFLSLTSRCRINILPTNSNSASVCEWLSARSLVCRSRIYIAVAGAGADAGPCSSISYSHLADFRAGKLKQPIVWRTTHACSCAGSLLRQGKNVFVVLIGYCKGCPVKGLWLCVSVLSPALRNWRSLEVKPFWLKLLIGDTSLILWLAIWMKRSASLCVVGFNVDIEEISSLLVRMILNCIVLIFRVKLYYI